MKKIITIFSLLLTTALSFGQHLQFNVSYSEPYATYDFLIKISENYPGNDLKAIFLKSQYNTESFKRQIAQFQQIKIDYSYLYNQYPQPLKIGFMSRDLLEKNLATSVTVDEFKNKSIGIITNEDLSAFSEIIQNFIPIYHELIFNPNQPALVKQKDSLSKYVEANRFAEFFQVGLTFYNAQWDQSIPFDLCLLPSLERGNLGARAFINVAVCEASLTLKDHKALFSVAMHEIYHIIYDSQPMAMKSNLKQWFVNTRSKNSQYALLLLNEVLATAIGNAYVMDQLNGRIDEQDWYDNKYITAMAKEIYPVVEEYIRKKQPIDENFVKVYVEKYDTKFSNWSNELDHLLAYRYIVADEADHLSYFRRNYRKYSNNRSGSPISASEIERMKDLPVTKVLVISKNNKQTLDLIVNSFGELKCVKMDHNKEFVRVFDLKDHTKLILINNLTTKFSEQFQQVFENRMIKDTY